MEPGNLEMINERYSVTATVLCVAQPLGDVGQR